MTINQFCIAVDEVQEIAYLYDLYDYLKANKRQYPLVSLRFMIEHMQEKARALGRRDAYELKQAFMQTGFL